MWCSCSLMEWKEGWLYNYILTAQTMILSRIGNTQVAENECSKKCILINLKFLEKIIDTI